MVRKILKLQKINLRCRKPGLSLHLLLLLIFFSSGQACTSRQDQPGATLSEEIFRNPSSDYRPLALWTWMNGHIDSVKLIYELEQMKDKGLRGAIIWDIGALINPEEMIPKGPAFLGPESLESIASALATSHELGLDLGISSASSWNSGGEWVPVEDGSKELLMTSEWLEGPASSRPGIKPPKSARGIAENCELLTVMAVPQNPDKRYDPEAVITFQINEKAGETAEWQVPDGRWEILSFYSCNSMQPLVVPSPNSKGLIIDHLSKKATERHFKELYARLDQISTPEKQMKFIFLDSYEVWEMTDWTPAFMREFEERYGYDPRPYLPLLKGFHHSDSLIQQRFDADYRRLVSNLLIENHYAKTVEMGEERGIQMITEAGHGGSPRVEPLKALGNSHIPMGEFWNRQRHWVTKEAASAAHIYGKKVVASESLTGWNHWQHGPTDFKQLIDIAFCEGLNQVVFHTFAHNPEIAGKPGFVYHAGEHVNVNATWWEMARPFMDYIGRCSYMLRQGNFVADVLLYYGDQAPNLVPPRRMDPNYTPDMPGIFPPYFYDESKCPHCGRPKPINPGNLPGYQSDYINEDVITRTLETENGQLVLPHGQAYKILVLPDRADISLEVLKQLDQLIYHGAVVVGRKPERSTSLKNYPANDQEVIRLADKIWGDCDGERILSHKYGKGTIYWGKSVKAVLEERGVQPDLQVYGTDNQDLHIDFVHRLTANEDIFFLSNSSKKQEKITCVFRVNQDSKPELWDAETGLVQREVEFAKVKNGLQLEMTMDPLASRFVIFRRVTDGVDDEGLYRNLQYGMEEQLMETPNDRSIDLSAEWDISFDSEMGGPGSLKLDSLTSWSELADEGARYYSGSAVYTREFAIDVDVQATELEAVVLFEDIQEMAQVFVNGNDCGIAWLPPYATRITPHLRPGINRISVKVVNTWNNRIVGDLRQSDRISFTRTNARGKFTANSPLLESGLLGKATIRFISRK